MPEHVSIPPMYRISDISDRAETPLAVVAIPSGMTVPAPSSNGGWVEHATCGYLVIRSQTTRPLSTVRYTLWLLELNAIGSIP
ncbi:hypothetical protein Y032_0028g1762 [Ancylostoma ceylanicum]|uniref:Uncharacterized protein n=1 Tax=Ancylostoma ceylanicum TaxID=53326 RepID=A0A016UST3_9BILA|nr:hypothetical protein Y032_0028g1762 [Ancylostoma ceylanicum]